MNCEQCGIKLENARNFCPLCGKELKLYKGVKHIKKSRIDQAFENNDFDFLWNLFESGQEPYAEYKYEQFILERAEEIDTPSDFDAFMGKIIEKAKDGNMYAKYLYGKSMRTVYRERGTFLLSGVEGFMRNPQKRQKGTDIVREAALNGQTSAEWTIGEIMWEGDIDSNIPKNEREAFRYINRAAQKGHPRAMLRLGEIYNQGMPGLARDYKKALVWVKSAAYFGCNTKNVEIIKGKDWLQSKDVEEIEKLYGLGRFKEQQSNEAFEIWMDFSQAAHNEQGGDKD